MKYEKLINELNDLLGSATKRSHKHQEKLKLYLGQFKAEEQKLRKKLKNESSEMNRGKLERELGMVEEAYVMLSA